MAEKSTTKNNNNWVRCQSKTRLGQYYMFNTKTAETRWCTESSDKTQQNISAKLKMKTPAQDRLKRLQKNLQKTNHKDSSLVKAKDASKSKKLDFSSQKRTVGPLKDKPSPSNEKVSVINRSEVTEETSVSKRTTEITTPQSNIEKQPPVATEEQNIIQSGNNKFRIPKKPNIQPENATKKFPAKRKHNEVNSTCSSVPKEQLLNQSTNDLSDLRKEIINVSSPKKARTSDEFENNQGKTSPDPEKVECDYNDNIAPSTDQKSTIMSVLKDYCSSLFKKAVHINKGNKSDDARKQLNLSHNSRPSFKSKEPVPKGSLQENQCRRNRCSANATLPSFSSTGCANDRLQRLRRSLQAQQTSINRTQDIKSPSSNSLISSPSKDSVCSLSSSHFESELMDWQPICENSPLNNTTSSSLSNGSFSNVSTRSEHWDTVNENLLRLAADKKQQDKHWKTDYFYFVIDTNVFLENVTFVDELTTMKLCDTAGTIIYIPYCVLQELDKLKIRSPSESIKTRSTRAIHFINKAFEKKTHHIQAQSSADENKHLIKVTSPDDSILNCCLQVKEHIENVMLLTEDINLRNKAMCSDILVSTKSDLISKHESLL